MDKGGARKIKAIGFDFGGVIEYQGTRSLMKDVADLLGVSLLDLRHVFFQHNHLANVEGWRFEDMFAKVVSFFNPSKEIEEKVRAMLRDSDSKSQINTELLKLFPILKKDGLKIGILSNSTSSYLMGKLKPNGIVEMVDEIVASSEIGFQKPHKEAFQVLFEKLQSLPEETIFVDDSSKSLEKAEEIGYAPILFKNNEQLVEDLKKFGIFV